jgi:hypothetical protein
MHLHSRSSIIALFGDGIAPSTAAVAKHVPLSERATLTRLKSMTSRGILVEIGTWLEKGWLKTVLSF